MLGEVNAQLALQTNRWATAACLGVAGSMATHSDDHGTMRAIAPKNSSRWVGLRQFPSDGLVAMASVCWGIAVP